MYKAENNKIRSSKLTEWMKIVGVFLLVFFVLSDFTQVSAVAATGSQVNVSVNYLEETAIVTGAGGNTKYYISLDNKNWDIMDVSGVIDISGILKNKIITVYFKGNKDTNPTSVNLQGEDNTLKVNYTMTEGMGTISYTSTYPVEYRKGVNGAWKAAPSSISTSIYEVKGAALFFRTIATIDRRPGKVVQFKISKRPTAPSVKLDGSKLMITGLKEKVTQYRVGDSTIWKSFTPVDSKSKSMDLSMFLIGALNSNTQIPAGTIEFRTVGTDKKMTSSVKTIEVALQPIVPDTITISGSSITITDTDRTRAYEYTVVAKNALLNMNTARWSMLSSKNAVIIPKVSVGDKVYVRLKSKTDSTTKQLILASTYKELPINSITAK